MFKAVVQLAVAERVAAAGAAPTQIMIVVHMLIVSNDIMVSVVTPESGERLLIAEELARSGPTPKLSTIKNCSTFIDVLYPGNSLVPPSRAGRKLYSMVLNWTPYGIDTSESHTVFPFHQTMK